VIYGSVNPPMFQRLPRTALRILDVGCGDGTLGRAIKAEWSAAVVGITHSAAEAERARTVLDEVVVADLETYEPGVLGRFDAVICSHVLEHLSHPERWLGALRSSFNPGGRLLVALPNVLFWRQRLQFLAGRFRYTEGGLMDSTHLRFYDWETAARLVSDSGYRILDRVADGGFPGSRWLGPLRPRVNAWATGLAPGLLGFQFILVAEPSSGRLAEMQTQAPGSTSAKQFS
jgi:SAM-dependent methyltransferase